MRSKKYHANSDGKFEFEFYEKIGKNFKSNSSFAYQFAANQFKSFKETYGVIGENCVFEADIDTLVAILAGILEEYETANPNNNILKIKPIAKQDVA